MPNKNNAHPQLNIMTRQRVIRRYRHVYALLLRLYSKPHQERFGPSMEQTFNDLLQERAERQDGLFTFMIWLFLETIQGIYKENLRYSIMQKKDVVDVAIGTGVILLLPLVGTLVSEEVVWDLADFVIAAILLMSTGFAYKFMSKKLTGLSYQMAVGVAVLAVLLLAWMNLAVGLLGNEENPANLMYFGVFAVGVIGTFFSHFRPQGMIRVMCGMALAQALVAMIALMIGIHRLPGHSVTEVVNLNGFFMLLFLVSALLFRHAAREKGLIADPEPQ